LIGAPAGAIRFGMPDAEAQTKQPMPPETAALHRRVAA
jgi:hypothetical protein